MTWDFAEQNTFSLVFPSRKLYFYPNLSIELVAMLLENPKTGRLGIVYESAISEKTVLLSFLQRKKVLRRNCMNYTSMERRNVKVLRDMGQKMKESRIFLYTSDCN